METPLHILHFETYSRHADADWMVLIHGAGGSTVTWKRQIPELSRYYNLLLVDLPGHGKMASRSNNDPAYSFEGIGMKIWEVIDHLKLTRVHLVGVSLGTVIALAMCEQRSHNVASLINGGAIVRLSKKLKLLARASLALAKVIGYPAFYKLSAAVMMPRKNHQTSRDVFIRESRFLSTQEFQKWTAMYRGLDETLNRLFHAEMAIPHLMVMGAQDHLFLDPARKYVALHNDVQLEILAGCGHVVSIEQAAKFNRLCLAFLNQLK